MKYLTNDQIETIKSPNRLGRKKTPLTEVYEAVYEKADMSFKNLRKISELLPHIAKNANKSKYAIDTLDLFGNPKNFNPILMALFPTKKTEGAEVDNRVFFDESKINATNAVFASQLLKFSSDYLLQAFPQQEYPNLHIRIQDLSKDLEGLVEAFNRVKALKKQVEEYRKHTEHFQPVGLAPGLDYYAVICRYCKVRDNGKSEEEAVFKIKHLEECQFLEVENKESRQIWSNWIEVLPPSNLVISWDERKKLDELK